MRKKNYNRHLITCREYKKSNSDVELTAWTLHTKRKLKCFYCKMLYGYTSYKAHANNCRLKFGVDINNVCCKCFYPLTEHLYCLYRRRKKGIIFNLEEKVEMIRKLVIDGLVDLQKKKEIGRNGYDVKKIRYGIDSNKRKNRPALMKK
jgi:hypothetical protein